MATDISNDDNTLDSRDIISAIEDLESEREDLAIALDEAQENLNTNEDETKVEELSDAINDAQAALAEWDEDNAEELKILKAFAEEAENSCEDWHYGATLIRESYFQQYAQELVHDSGDLPTDLPSYIVIDWDATTDNLRQDYSEVEWDGVSYLCR